jgi:hypothetical protein
MLNTTPRVIVLWYQQIFGATIAQTIFKSLQYWDIFSIFGPLGYLTFKAGSIDATSTSCRLTTNWVENAHFKTDLGGL